jgi:hypothetical protein
MSQEVERNTFRTQDRARWAFKAGQDLIRLHSITISNQQVDSNALIELAKRRGSHSETSDNALLTRDHACLRELVL